jgi:V/A-type H+/Na+-transporting ATPase subunit I
MIAKMLKYSFLIFHKEYEHFLEKLRKLGIAHIIENNEIISEEIHNQYQEITKVGKVIRSLEKRDVGKAEKLSESDADGEDIYNSIERLDYLKDNFTQKSALLSKQIFELKPWGDFNPEIITKLNEYDIRLRLFSCQTRNFNKKWQQDYNLFIINIKAGYNYFAIIEKDDEEIEINAEEFYLPEKNLSRVIKEQKEIETELEEIEQRLDEITIKHLPALKNYRNQLINKIEYDKALHNTINEFENNLKIVEVWCPAEKSELLEDEFEKQSIPYLKSEASKDEKVPVLLKNKKFNRDFELIGDLYSLPKYGEMDLTPFFAPFYALFFGFCLGDVGYGLLMLIAAIAIRPRVQKEIKPVTNLVAYLGTATILFGLIGGTFFGIDLYETNLPVYSSVQEYLQGKDTNINNFLFYLSILIGGVQIIFGLFIKAINETIQFGWKVAMGTYGWIWLILGLISVYLAGEYTEIAPEILSVVQNVVLISAGLMILLLNNLKRKIYINLGVGLWDSYNMVTGLLGDLLSYIRLFALGISSAILGYVFNSLAVSMSGDIPVLSLIIMIIILVIGHAINLFMSGLGSFVHPMRLTFVEFYKNAGFTGGGKQYHPFKKR